MQIIKTEEKRKVWISCRGIKKRARKVDFHTFTVGVLDRDFNEALVIEEAKTRLIKEMRTIERAELHVDICKVDTYSDGVQFESWHAMSADNRTVKLSHSLKSEAV